MLIVFRVLLYNEAIMSIALHDEEFDHTSITLNKTKSIYKKIIFLCLFDEQIKLFVNNITF